jgi:hypothetical protein
MKVLVRVNSAEENEDRTSGLWGESLFGYRIVTFSPSFGRSLDKADVVHISS